MNMSIRSLVQPHILIRSISLQIRVKRPKLHMSLEYAVLCLADPLDK